MVDVKNTIASNIHVETTIQSLASSELALLIGDLPKRDVSGTDPKCALKCTTEGIAVYWACAAVCIKEGSSNECITVACPAGMWHHISYK